MQDVTGEEDMLNTDILENDNSDNIEIYLFCLFAASKQLLRSCQNFSRHGCAQISKLL